MSKDNEDKELQTLTDEELHFCDLYVNGGMEYAGRPSKCYKAVYGEKVPPPIPIISPLPLMKL